MHPSRNKKRIRRYQGTSVSTVNIGLDYGLAGSSITNASQHHASKTRGALDDFDLKMGRPSYTHSNQSFSSGPPKSNIQSALQERPSSGDSCKSKDHHNEATETKPFWKASSMFKYANKSAQNSLLHHGNRDTTNGAMEGSAETSNHMSNSSPHFYLPGDRVIFTQDSGAPGIPVIYRIEEEKRANPDKLNLDRRDLTVCPVLEGEENLRLLNFQHNLIRRIENLSYLRKLIFLDLYDNQIEEISGLSSLKSLRVLMLGKNRIKRICSLDDLLKLDVLDLHGNKISKIENLSHLVELRVLNLAGNALTIADNLSGLESLTELNLRRNKISSVRDIDRLPSLQRLFLSHNEIKVFQDIACFGFSNSLAELSLDGNPIANDQSYRSIILQKIISLKQLDMKKISEEERRIISAMAKKEGERRREMERISSLKERRQLAIDNAKRQYQAQSASLRISTENSHSRSSTPSGRSPKKSLSIGCDYSVCHLAELDEDHLKFYGPGSLEAVDRNWGEKAAFAVNLVSFNFINFDKIVPFLTKIKNRFVNVAVLKFGATNICQFNQVNSLGIFRNLEELIIEDSGNPITQFSLWKPYVLYRLSHLSLQMINGCEVTSSDSVHAERLFGALGHVTASQLLQSWLITMLAKQKKLGLIQDFSKEDATAEFLDREKVSNATVPVGRTGLIYQPTVVSKQETEDTKQRKKAASKCFSEVVQRVTSSEKRREQFQKVWPGLFNEYLQQNVRKMENIDRYMEASLEEIKKS